MTGEVAMASIVFISSLHEAEEEGAEFSATSDRKELWLNEEHDGMAAAVPAAAAAL